MRRTAFFAMLLLVAAVASLDADRYPRNFAIDAWHYVFRLTLSDTSPEIQGEATVEIRFVRDSVGEFELDLASAVDGKGMVVAAVTSNGRPLRYSHQANRLKISLPEAPRAGERRAFTITYHGVPANGLRLITNKYGEWSAFSENWPDRAREWLPMIDHPYDKATSEFIVTAPSRYQVVANGLLQEELDLGDGRRTTHWKQSVPIASWLNAIGVAQFSSHHAGTVSGVELQTWVFHQDREAGWLYFEEPARRAMDFYTEYVGPYAYEKLANVEAAGIGGGTEHASAIFYGERGLRAAPAWNLVAHEIAHQWFGNSVTERDWDDVWLSEGFATYFTLLVMEHAEGRDAFVAGLKASRERILQLEQRMPDTPVIHRNLADMRKVLNQFVYQKGGWTLHMLRGLVGSAAFRVGVREYYRRYRDQNASTDEFRQVMEQAAGGVDLTWFFEQWLTRSGEPRLEGSWRYVPGRKEVEVTVAQSQVSEPYRLPLDVGLILKAGTPARVEHVELRDRTASFAFAADTEPVAVILDPDTWLLMEAGPFTQVK